MDSPKYILQNNDYLLSNGMLRESSTVICTLDEDFPTMPSCNITSQLIRDRLFTINDSIRIQNPGVKILMSFRNSKLFGASTHDLWEVSEKTTLEMQIYHSSYKFQLTINEKLTKQNINALLNRIRTLTEIYRNDVKRLKCNEVLVSGREFDWFLIKLASEFRGDKILSNRSLIMKLLGKRIASDAFTLIDYPIYFGMRSNKDIEGTIKTPVTLVNQGVVSGFLHTKKSAQKMNEKPNGRATVQSDKIIAIPEKPQLFSSDSINESIGPYDFECLHVDFEGAVKNPVAPYIDCRLLGRDSSRDIGYVRLRIPVYNLLELIKSANKSHENLVNSVTLILT